MSYSYYQQSGTPGWGTSQFTFPAPPTVQYQPQPSWGGHDFFRAHAGNSMADPTLFDHAWNRVREHQDGTSGVGLHEARHWHRRAYGGLGDLGQMSPSEVGHAAAYEAYRTWLHNTSLREPLSGDLDRQREGLAGLAVAEASRLLQYSTRPMDSYARMEASEAAATTASILFYEGRERDNGDYHRGRSTSRHRGHHDSYSDYDEPYAYDSEMFHRQRPRSHSRHRSHSRPRSPSHHHHSMMGYPASGVAMSHGSVMQGGMPMQTGVPGGLHMPGSMSMQGGVPMQGVPSGYGGGGVPFGSYPPGMVAGHTASYGGVPQYASSASGVPIQYAQSVGGVPMAMNAQPYGTQTVLTVPHHRGRSTSISVPYGAQQYVPSAGGTQYVTSAGQQYIMPQGVPQTQSMIINKPHKKHRDHSKHRSKRSKSSEPRYITY